jgi:nitroimidazol reductase NimA-like FMN-containing flavoprotein (pyridoxamine 5'-phosphate oxidase superfamily)
MTIDGADPQVLAPAECLRLLGGERIGRVAISVNALPAILPVRFALDRDEIFFRAAPGGVLAEATRQSVIAFEADGSEPGVGSWSVLATGLARHLTEPDALALTSLPPWSSEADVFVALTPQLLTGRRLTEPATNGGSG